MRRACPRRLARRDVRRRPDRDFCRRYDRDVCGRPDRRFRRPDAFRLAAFGRGASVGRSGPGPSGPSPRGDPRSVDGASPPRGTDLRTTFERPARCRHRRHRRRRRAPGDRRRWCRHRRGRGFRLAGADRRLRTLNAARRRQKPRTTRCFARFDASRRGGGGAPRGSLRVLLGRRRPRRVRKHPLIVAAQFGRKRVTKMCVAGADSTRSTAGHGALHYCYSYGHFELGEYLVHKGARSCGTPTGSAVRSVGGRRGEGEALEATRARVAERRAGAERRGAGGRAARRGRGREGGADRGGRGRGRVGLRARDASPEAWEPMSEDERGWETTDGEVTEDEDEGT